MIARAPVPEVSDARGLTRERFEALCIHPPAPVVLRGLVAHWDWVGKTTDHLVAEWPSRTFFTHGIMMEGLSRERLALTRADIAGYFMPDRDSKRRPGDGLVIEVASDVPEILPLFPAPKIHRGTFHHRIFMGRDTITDTHYHVSQHNLICQVVGRKRLLLHPPEDTPNLYARSFLTHALFNTTEVDFAAPDLTRFPRLSKTRPLETILEPGDALFVPVHWWHTVYGLGPVLSVSLFWPALLREHRFPYPGIRNFAGLLRLRVSARLRRWTPQGSERVV